MRSVKTTEGFHAEEVAAKDGAKGTPDQKKSRDEVESQRVGRIPQASNAAFIFEESASCIR